MSTIQIEKEDVVKLIIQFMRENNLPQSLKSLERETNLTLNTIDNIETFLNDIKHGRWDTVLKQLQPLTIEDEKLFDLHEQIVLELIENDEISAAQIMLRRSNVLRLMNEEYPERYSLIERHLDSPTSDLYRGTAKQERRLAISQQLEQEVSTVPSSRLLALLGQSLKWQQQQQGVVVPGSSYDIFRGTVPVQKAEDDAFISNHYVSIKFPGKKTYAECAAFSKDGTYLATGSMDGFIEIWNYLTGKLRKDLKYQAKDRLMAMDKAVLCLEFSPNNELLASGSMDGKVIVWKVQTGQRQRIISPAHTEGVTCVCFSKDSTQIVSGSHDQTVRIHGLKSGKMLKEFRGHTSFVNAVLYSSDSSRILSASSDGTLKIWDVKTTDCLYTVTPQPKLEKNELNPVGGLGSASVQAIVPVPRKQDHYIVCNKTNTLFLVSLRGQIVKTYTHNKKHDFITAAVSAQGDYIYGISEDSVLYCFQLATGAAVGNFKICDSEIVGMASHPLANILVVHDDAGHVYFYKA